jgi:ribokinase
MADRPLILVVGSVNMDLVVRAPHMPAPGETILGDGFRTFPGGKGANQAVAVARLGARCRMIARVGDDAFGRTLLAGLEAEGIDCQAVMVTPSPSGVAMIVVDSSGENSIVVASGANALLTPDDVFAREALFADAAVVVLQLELPLTTVRAAVQLARRHGCKIVLDPAPAPRELPPELYEVDVISPNVSEAEALTGSRLSGGQTVNDRVDKMVACELIARGAKTAVLKLGPRGSLVVTSDCHFYTVPAYKVTVVDTTAAGDAFTAALAVALADGKSPHESARFANAAGALGCTKFGAQSSMPTAAEVRILMEDQPI